MNITTLLKISRPRFWLYAGGSFLVGIMAAANSVFDLLDWRILLFLLFFMIPANIFIYGINDLFDNDTDSTNPKKGDKEHLLRMQERSSLQKWVWGSVLLGLAFLPLAPNNTARWLIVLFLFLAWAYSSLPFRFKAKPFIDALSNVHYAVIGFAGYAFVSGQLPPWWAIAAAWCWTAAMHIYSAVPDIYSDTQAGLTTTAVFLRARPALWLCVGLWTATSVLVIDNFAVSPLVWLVIVYPIIGVYTAIRLQQLYYIYWFFPYINALAGFLLFILVA